MVKGPNSALFGFNAVGGVVNIITYNPLYDDIDVATVTGGTQGWLRGAAIGTFRLGEGVGVRVSVNGLQADEFDTDLPQGAVGIRQDLESYEFNIDGIVQLADNVQARLEVAHSETDKSDGIVGGNFGLGNYSLTSVLGKVSADTRWGLIEITGYTNIADIQNEVPNPPAYDFDNQVSVFRIEDLFKIGADHTFRLLGEYRHNSMDTTPFDGATVSYDVYSAAAMWNWAVSARVNLTAAVRLDHLELDRQGAIPAGAPFTNADWEDNTTEYSVNLGAVWLASDFDTFSASYARGIQVRSLSQFGGFLLPVQFGGGPAFLVTNLPILEQPTVVQNLEIGYDRLLPALGATARIRGFYQYNDDLLATGINGVLTVPPTPTTLPVSGFLNIGDSELLGLELGLDGEMESGVRWGVNATWLSVEDDFILPPQNLGFQPAESSPELIVNGQLGWSGGGFDADVYLRYVDDFTGKAVNMFGVVGDVPVDAYVTADARLGYRLNEDFEIALSGRNLFEDGQPQSTGLEQERMFWATLTARF